MTLLGDPWKQTLGRSNRWTCFAPSINLSMRFPFLDTVEWKVPLFQRRVPWQRQCSPLVVLHPVMLGSRSSRSLINRKPINPSQFKAVLVANRLARTRFSHCPLPGD